MKRKILALITILTLALSWIFFPQVNPERFLVDREYVIESDGENIKMIFSDFPKHSPLDQVIVQKMGDTVTIYPIDSPLSPFNQQSVELKLEGVKRVIVANRSKEGKIVYGK